MTKRILYVYDNYAAAFEQAQAFLGQVRRLVAHEVVWREQPRFVVIFNATEHHFESAGQPERLRGMSFDEVVCSPAIDKRIGNDILRALLCDKKGKLTIR